MVAEAVMSFRAPQSARNPEIATSGFLAVFAARNDNYGEPAGAPALVLIRMPPSSA
jgi:hypothetical protein